VVVAAESPPLCDESLSPSLDDDARLLLSDAAVDDVVDADVADGARSLAAGGAGALFAAG